MASHTNNRERTEDAIIFPLIRELPPDQRKRVWQARSAMLAWAMQGGKGKFTVPEDVSEILQQVFTRAREIADAEAKRTTSSAGRRKR